MWTALVFTGWYRQPATKRAICEPNWSFRILVCFLCTVVLSKNIKNKNKYLTVMWDVYSRDKKSKLSMTVHFKVDFPLISLWQCEGTKWSHALLRMTLHGPLAYANKCLRAAGANFSETTTVVWEFSKCAQKCLWLVSHRLTFLLIITCLLARVNIKCSALFGVFFIICVFYRARWIATVPLLKSQKSRLHQLIVKSAGVFRAWRARLGLFLLPVNGETDSVPGVINEASLLALQKVQLGRRPWQGIRPGGLCRL